MQSRFKNLFPLKTDGKTEHTGLWIAIYGPDGAGKSAVAQRLSTELTPIFNGVRLRHLRVPMYGSQPATVVTEPHAKPPRGFTVSCLKLLYMFAQGWIAHLSVLTWVTHGQLVIFDRYFLDYAIDPQRYRLAASTVRLASLLGKLAPRPDVQFVLDVRGEELQRRKPEVSMAESKRQRCEYAARVARLPNAVLINADRPLVAVAAEVGNHVLQLVNHRSLSMAKATSRRLQDAVR